MEFVHGNKENQGTGEEFLNDFFSVLYESIVSLNNPIISARDYIRRLRKTYYVRDIDKILCLTDIEKEKMLNIMTDFVTSSDYTMSEMVESYSKIHNKITEDSEYGEIFKKLDTHMNSLKKQEKRLVLRSSFKKLYSQIQNMQSEINERIIEVENPSELLIISESLIVLEHTIDVILSKIKHKKSFSRYNIFLSTLLMRFEAVRLKKMPIENLMNDLSFYTSFFD